MKKTISQISLIILIMIIGMLSVCAEQVHAASIVQVSSHTAKVGDTVTVTVTLPDGTVGYDGSVSFDSGKLQHVSNSNNGTVNGGKILVSDANTNVNQVSNLTITFKVIAEGEAIVSSNLNCVDRDNKVIYSGANAGTIKNPTSTTPPPSTTPPANNNNNNNENKKEPKFTAVNETVYTKETCNVRESYSTDSKKLTKFEKGKEVKRTGVGDNGWSKIEYDGKIAYISSEFLTTDKPADPTFKDVDETMYAVQDCNVRENWTTDSNKVGYLKEGQEIKRTGIGENGWSKIDYNGKVAYVATRLLSKEKPDLEENEIDNNTVDNNTVVNEENVVDNELLGTLQNEIGVIPEVGNNYSEYAYIFVSLVALIGVLYISYKSRSLDK